MRNIKSTDRFKIWEVVDKNGYAEVRMSESRKIKEDNAYDMNQVANGVAQNGYIGTNWSYIRFTGHAYNKLKELGENPTITNLSMDISREPYFGDTNTEINAAIDLLERMNVVTKGSIPKRPRNDGVVYPRNVRITVFGFNTLEEAEAENNNASRSRNLDRTPAVETSQPVKPQQQVVYQQAPIMPQNIQMTTPSVEASDDCPF